MRLLNLGLILVILGFILIFALAISLLVFSILVQQSEPPRIAGGACIIIGFIPICLGVGDPTLIVVLMVLAIVLIAASFMLTRMLGKQQKATAEGGVEPW